MSKLVIVESPAKAKTIKKYLGSGFEVMASMGHVRDLPKSSLGVNVDKGFRPQYLNITGKEKLIAELKKAAAASEQVYLATDPDREGEAISWHLAYLLGLDENADNRVTFGEITQKGVEAGMSAPRAIDQDLVNAQQARRILDRIVGYKLSPFLWRKVRRGLSAGRVQSVAVRLLVDREREIEAFIPEEFWTVDAMLRAPGSQRVFAARLRGKVGNADEFKIGSEEQCNAVLAELEGHDFTVSDVKTGVRKRVPEPPFITSTLQQDASRRLGFTARRTMKAAQELYEGVDVAGVGTTGLITYMRTDSLRISDDAHAEALAFIEKNYGSKYACRSSRSYSRKKSAVAAQDAHEAIRPTSVELTPERVKSSLTSDQFKLYELIWKRFVASRMSDQVQDTVSADILCGDYLFRANGFQVRFEGFAVLYEVATDEKADAPTVLPSLEVGSTLKKKDIKPEQRFTQPPPRYTEASLIKVLEENGIGRPSTYAPIISTVLDRNYVERNKKQLVPTSLGMIVADLMKAQFPDIVDVRFSAGMEKDLDKIEEGKAQWQKVLERFYKDFSKNLKKAEADLEGKRIEVPVEVTDVICELCGKNMVVKSGRYGKFLACPGFPSCRNTKRIVDETPGLCPKCGGKIVGRRSQKGRLFYACEKGRECGFMSWYEPVADLCPNCGSTLFKKKGRYPELICQKEGCDYKKAAEK